MDGQNWQDVGEGIPGGPVNVIMEDPDHDGIVYVGTDLGVYVSIDDCKTWDVLGSGLPITFVHDLAIQERDKVLVAATHGRGMYTLRLQTVYSAWRQLNNVEEESDDEDGDE